jgi:hypothetical protein
MLDKLGYNVRCNAVQNDVPFFEILHKQRKTFNLGFFCTIGDISFNVISQLRHAIEKKN